MNSSKFFRVIADPKATSRWYLRAPIDPSGQILDPRTFTQGRRVDSQPQHLTIPLRRGGEPIDFNFCDFDMVVTPARLNAKLEALVGSEIQRVPVSVVGCDSKYEILNVCQLASCFDQSRSSFIQWSEDDGRPEKVGAIRMVTKLRIDPVEVGSRHIFRVDRWPIALILSEEVKLLFETDHVSGVAYERVD